MYRQEVKKDAKALRAHHIAVDDMPRKPANVVSGVSPTKKRKKVDVVTVDSDAEEVSSSPPPTTGTTRGDGNSNQSEATPVYTSKGEQLMAELRAFAQIHRNKKEEILVSNTNSVASMKVPLPRRSSRKIGSQKSSVPNQSAASDPSLKMKRIDKLYTVYADKKSCQIGPGEIETLCADLGVRHTDVRILMLAWKMKSERQGYFSLEEWRRGLMALDATTIRKLKVALQGLEKEVRSSQNFRDFYRYAFTYSLTVELQKTIDITSTCELLKIVLRPQFPPQVDKFITFLMCQKEYKVISLDQWEFIPLFCNEIHFPSLDNYDSAYAWPSIFDSFVEWMPDERKLS